MEHDEFVRLLEDCIRHVMDSVPAMVQAFAEEKGIPSSEAAKCIENIQTRLNNLDRYKLAQQCLESMDRAGDSNGRVTVRSLLSFASRVRFAFYSCLS